MFCTFGSLGDLYPILALAREMKLRGQSPLVATSPVYQALVEREEVEFYPVRPDVDVTDPEVLRRAMDRHNGSRYVLYDVVLPALRESYEDIAAAAKDAHLLVVHPIVVAAFLFARKSNVPWVSVAMAPASLCSAYDPSVPSGVPFGETLASSGPAVQSGLLEMLSLFIEPLWKPFRQLEKDLGLARAPNPLSGRYSPQLVLGLFSPVLAAPQPDWPANTHATGFPFFGGDQRNSDALQSFLEAGDPPIVFTLGSAAVGTAGDFFAQSAKAARELGRRAVLMVERDQRNQTVDRLRPDIVAVPYAPHSAVFPHGCVNVHQGGIGTTGEAMRAGRPMLIVHYSHDQPDQAARLSRLGVARGISREDYTADTATREIRALIENVSYANAAAEVGKQVRAERGTTNACDLLCSCLG